MDFSSFASFATLGAEEPKQAVALAPAPQLDRWPIVIGAALTGQYLSSAFRLCTSGYRTQFVDVLNELLEHDPHARGVVRQRILAVAGARIEIDAAALPPDDPEIDLAKTIRDEVAWQFERIPRRSQAFAALLWAIIYGVTLGENHWTKADFWRVNRIGFVHSRRLSYPDPSRWDLYVWDQGAAPFNGSRGAGVYGLRVDDYPNKFIVHAPQLNGDYATRDGEGRYIAFFLLLKRTIVRATAQDFERTIRPWVIAYFNRLEPKDAGSANARSVAAKEDIAAADAAVRALGVGSLNGATLPDSIRIELLRAASNSNPQQFVEWLDAQVSKSLLGQTFTTESGKYGSRSTAQVGAQGSQVIARYDGLCFADTLSEYLVNAIVRLNWPDKMHLAPTARVVTDEKPDPKAVMDLAAKGTSIDMPIDVDKLSEMTGMPLTPREDGDTEPRRTRMLSPGKQEAPPIEGTELEEDDNELTPPADDEEEAALPPN